MRPADAAKISLYLRPATYDLARAAYTADRTHQATPPATLIDWITRAIDRHAERTPARRAALAVPREAGRGRSYALAIPPTTRDAMDAALAADEHAERPGSRSSFTTEAIHAAASSSRRRTGGTLPTPNPLPRGRRPAR